ncbi:PQQ-dependent sugar dehydrogenase [Glutamicibacter sp. NPDC087344]|uniref:PQQ-dependent sugar dehydrogenase n=1 Tax=Glutamicibacter sp. NPDC087344 TaxID=3363994 RepID=UPI0038087F20
MQRSRALSTLIAAGLLLASCSVPNSPAPTSPLPNASGPNGTEPTSDAPTKNDPEQTGQQHTLATNLAAPWSVAAAGDVLLLSERDTGRILEVLDQGEVREVARLNDVSFGGEGGLLGLAFKTPDRLYAYSTGSQGNRIQEFQLSGTAGSYSLSAPTTLLDALPSASNHNGGRLAFGPDGLLYASVGDAGRPANAQDLGSLGGKILRLTADGEIPADNPFPDSYVYSYGHRNVQGLAWDADGTMYASEFGQNTWDELNRITAGGNYGWPEAEGHTSNDSGFINPIAQWPTDQASPSGITIIDSVLYLANLRGQRLRAVQLADPTEQRELLGELGRLRDVAPGAPGQLLVLTNNTDSRGDPGPGDDQLISIELSEVN